MKDIITVGEFAEMLGDPDSTWIEEQDEINHAAPLERGTAARLLHMYMKTKLGINDVDDITPAYVLKDLFDCRVCANHIAQVYLRGIMDAVRIESLLIFDVHAPVTRDEALGFISRAL